MWNRSENQIKITFIRHGATPSNLESRYLGWTEESLSEEGIKKIKEQWTEIPKVQKVFASPMKRCLETAKIIFPEESPVVIPTWKEMNFGEFEGKNYRELSGNLAYQKWIDSQGMLPFPGGESREAFIKRTMEGFATCMEICKKEGYKEIACIVHGGTIMAIGSQITGEDYYSFQRKPGEKVQLFITIEEKERE